MLRVKRRIMNFGIVGVLNTIIDFSVLNICTLLLGIPKIPSNIASTTIAMIFSFFTNKRIVFESHGKINLREVVSFFTVTIFGLYVIQTAIIYGLLDYSKWFEQLVSEMLRIVGMDSFVSIDFAAINGAKVVATAASMIWNYALYQRFVFPEATFKPEAESDIKDTN